MKAASEELTGGYSSFIYSFVEEPAFELVNSAKERREVRRVRLRARHANRYGIRVTADRFAMVQQRFENGGSAATKGVQHQISRPRPNKVLCDETLRKHREVRA
jgi:hypothetical protein